MADALGVGEVGVDDDLRETAFGDWDGYSFAEVAQRWPTRAGAMARPRRRWRRPSASPSTPCTPGSSAARDRITASYRGSDVVVVVSHVTPIKALVRLALDAPAHALFRMELSPASATTVHWWPGGVASLRSFNVLAHDAPGPGDDA